MPRAMKRSCSISRWHWTSPSNSSSSLRRLRVPTIRERISRSIASVLAVEPQHAADQARNSFPALGFASELFAAGAGDRVEPRLAVVFRGAPLRTDPTLLCQPQQRGVYRALVQAQHLITELLDAPCDSIAVQRA